MSSDYDAVSRLLLTESLSDMLERAKEKDVLAAREALTHIAFMLCPSNKEAIPDYVREYLANCLREIANGSDANDALNLKKRGKSKWTHFDKRLAANVMFELVENGSSVEDAKYDAAYKINEIVRSIDDPASAWSNFKNIELSPEALQSWYYETKDELSDLHNKARYLQQMVDNSFFTPKKDPL